MLPEASKLGILVKKAFAQGVGKELGNRVNTQFGHQLGTMIVDGFRADRKALGDLGVAATFGDQVQNLAFPDGQGGPFIIGLQCGHDGAREEVSAIQNQLEPIAHLACGTALEDSAFNPCGNPIRQVALCREPRDQANACRGRPAADFAVDFHAPGQRHGAVQQQQLGLQGLAKRDRLQPVMRLPDDLGRWHIVDDRLQGVADQHMIIRDDNSIRVCRIAGL